MLIDGYLNGLNNTIVSIPIPEDSVSVEMRADQHGQTPVWIVPGGVLNDSFSALHLKVIPQTVAWTQACKDILILKTWMGSTFQRAHQFPNGALQITSPCGHISPSSHPQDKKKKKDFEIPRLRGSTPPNQNRLRDLKILPKNQDDSGQAHWIFLRSN